MRVAIRIRKYYQQCQFCELLYNNYWKWQRARNISSQFCHHLRPASINHPLAFFRSRCIQRLQQCFSNVMEKCVGMKDMAVATVMPSVVFRPKKKNVHKLRMLSFRSQKHHQSSSKAQVSALTSSFIYRRCERQL